MAENTPVWGTFKLEKNSARFLKAGPLLLWIKQMGDEIWLGHLYEEELPAGEKPSGEPPESIEWARWALKSAVDELTVMPAFPDLPIVVRSEYPLRVAQNASIQIFTRVPVWLRVHSPKHDYTLTEIPTLWLSHTWFGTTLEGELCYWLKTKARRTLDKVEAKEYVVNCPIWITNRSENDLDFEKFCFRVERLGIYAKANQLWADETRIIYHGDEQNSDITMTGKLPEGINKKDLLAEPRNPLKHSFATRTFKKLFDDTTLIGR